MPKLILKSLFVLVCNGCFFLAKAQTPITDSMLLQQSVTCVKSSQKKLLAENLRLYNGTSYSNPYSGAKGFPYFSSDALQPGDIFYDGTLYDSIPMFYDLTTDEVVIESYSHQYNIKLHKEKTRYFVLAKHLFVLLRDSVQNATVKNGFYDLVYKNKTEVYIRREKALRQQAKLDGIDARFTDYVYYYIKKDGTFFAIQSSRDMQDVFKDKKNEVKNFLHKNHLSFRKDTETALAKAAEYYDSLTK